MTGTAGLKPLLFVVMPFGKKPDATGTHTIDFDRIYELAIKPAAEAADLEVIRADEERSGGIIHVPMFERLLLAEIVVADLTTPNPNVFYELGVRHCARPRSTILIYARGNQLPFDVRMIRALPYDLKDGTLTEPAAATLREALARELADARRDLEQSDSPLFQLIPSFPGVTLSATDTIAFRDRARAIQRVRDRLAEARRLPDRAQALAEIRAIEAELGDLATAPSELVVDLLFSYRDVEAYDAMVSLVERLPPGPVAEAARIREAYGFALNRRNGPGDRQRAVRVLEGVVETHGPSPETCGLLGRIYKDWYDGALRAGQTAQAAAYLDEAITWYRRGFEADPRDYYPGINLATLLLLKGDAGSLAELRTIAAAVAFAVVRRGGVSSRDYWDVATVLEAAVLGEDWALAERAAARLLILDAPDWMRASTANNLRLIRRVREERGQATDTLDGIIAQLAPAPPGPEHGQHQRARTTG
jgi:tetratricopeptide (TPR) repeat protein